MRTETGPAKQRLSDYAPTPFAVDTVELTFRLDPAATKVRAVMTMRRREGVNPEAPLELAGDETRLVLVALDGEPLAGDRYDATPDGLTIRDLPDAFTLMIETEVDPSNNTQLSGLYRSSGTYCTQCEAEGFRRIVYMYDRPDVLAVWTTRIEAPAGEPVLLGNGDLVEEGDLEGGGRYAVWHDPHPKPAYLFALVAGDLGRIEDRFSTMEGREVLLRIYVEHGNEERAAWAMDSLIRSMKWDEERFGRAYDLDRFNIVAVSDFNMGAMENKGLNIFNDKLILASPETATDTDYARIEAVVAHEYFHNWTGNRITCRDWFQLCLKEGLTVYRDHEFQADMRDRDVRRIDEVRTLRAIQFPEDQSPLRHPVRPREVAAIDNFYTATIYEKGSELVRMIATLLGREAFRAGMDLYFERHDGEACTIEQFVACFEEAGDTDLAQFMRWYAQPGTPTVAIEASEDGGDLVLGFEQSQPPAPDGTMGEPLVVPIALELIGAGSPALQPEAGGRVIEPDGRTVLVLEAGKASFRARRAAGATPVPFEGFSAPVLIERRGPPEEVATERIAIAREARDPFSRWNALNAAMLDLLVDRARGADSATAGDPVEALGASLADEGLTPAFRAELLKLPGESEVGRALGSDVDPDVVRVAREDVVTRIADEQGEALARLYETTTIEGGYAPDAEQSGQRALRNAALDVLARVEGPERAAAQFGGATNMTDRFAALSTLVLRHTGSGEAEHALRAYEERYRDDALAMDKWLGVQAMAPGPDALDTVLRLESHRSYEALNPNRVRALWGAFAMGNPTGFARADGRSFEAFAERLASFDRHNPQLAARLATALREHARWEEGRREKARNSLTRLLDRDGLSRDLRDILSRTLGN